MYVDFYRLAVGAVFEWRGQRYRKEAPCMACDEGRPDGRRWGHIMQGQVWVISDGPFLSTEEAAEVLADGHRRGRGVWEPVVVGRDWEARELGGA
jgi:hypothetical protein